MIFVVGFTVMLMLDSRLNPSTGALACPEKVNTLRSYEVAWRTYIRGHVVSRHAKQITVQFMAACCGKSKRADVDAEDITRQKTCWPI